MKYFISKSIKASLDYLIAFVLFVIFLFVVIIAAGENFSKWIPAYSILVFILLSRLLYIDFRKVGAAEIKQH
ncbi:MAG: hypothetical protein PHX37_00270, partial [Eubacteriales bacterium]|nr:hypothetical protein [Eubacteriales bacterium]